jgi:hypothetical protein
VRAKMMLPAWKVSKNHSPNLLGAHRYTTFGSMCAKFHFDGLLRRGRRLRTGGGLADSFVPQRAVGQQGNLHFPYGAGGTYPIVYLHLISDKRALSDIKLQVRCSFTQLYYWEVTEW